jgi:hypothetical protein
MAQCNIWVHGVAVEADFPADFVEAGALAALHFVERNGNGITFESTTPFTHGFHVSIPSPSILNDFRMRLRGIFIFYDTNGATINTVHVFDGPRLVHTFNNLGWSGNHSNSFDASNVLRIPSENISSGIGIFVEVDFSNPPTPLGTRPQIRFSAAGVQLLTGELLRPTTILRIILSWFERRLEARRG